jgi:hypothetical protein
MVAESHLLFRFFDKNLDLPETTPGILEKPPKWSRLRADFEMKGSFAVTDAEEQGGEF